MVVTNARVASPRSPINKKINKKGHKMKLHKPNQHSSSSKLKELTKDVGSASSLASKINCTAQELKFAKIFAGNNTIQSASQLGKLKKWLKIRSNSSVPFEDQDFLRIWKGLFYCMWMSDKPLPQEKLADDIALLVHCFDQPIVSIQFFGMFLKIMSMEWFGIDQWRIDKFMMLVRRVMRQMFVALHNENWTEELIDNLNAKIEANALNSSVNIGFSMHFIEIYFEEVAKVTKGEIPMEAVTSLCKPFAEFIAKPRNLRLAKHAVKYTFKHLLFQSEMGLEYKEKFDAWKSLGFPGNSIDDMELVEPDEEEEEVATAESGEDDDDDEKLDEEEEQEEGDDKEINGALDPRAGRVDVLMPQIPFDPLSILKLLQEANTKKYTNVKTRRVIAHVIQSYSTYSSGRFPLGIQKIKSKSDKIELPKISDKVNEWLEFEKKLYGKDRQMKSLNKKKRKKMMQTNGSIAPSPPKKMRPNSTIDTDTSNSTPTLIKKRKLPLTPLERKKINQWQEDDIIIPSTSTINEHNQNNDDVEDFTIAAVADDFVKSSTPKSSAIKKKKLKLENFELNETTESILVDSVTAAPIKLTTNLQKEMTPSKSQTVLSSNIVINPAAIRGKLNSIKKDKLYTTPQTPQQEIKHTAVAAATAQSSEKKVKIMLKFNRSQDTSEYMKQLRSSPNVPYDSAKKPTKGLLKPNLMPSPINPFYKKKLGLNF